MDRELDNEPVRHGPRRRRPSKLDPYKEIIDTRLAEYPELSAVRLFEEVRAAGCPLADFDFSFQPTVKLAGERPGASAPSCGTFSAIRFWFA